MDKKNTVHQGKTLTRADLTDAVHKVADIQVMTATNIVDAVIDEITDILASEDSLKLSGFGTFKKNRKKQRIGRNPKTGVEVPITPRVTLSFNASNLIKKAVNEALSGRNNS